MTNQKETTRFNSEVSYLYLFCWGSLSFLGVLWLFFLAKNPFSYLIGGILLLWSMGSIWTAYRFTYALLKPDGLKVVDNGLTVRDSSYTDVIAVSQITLKPWFFFSRIGSWGMSATSPKALLIEFDNLDPIYISPKDRDGFCDDLMTKCPSMELVNDFDKSDDLP